MNYALVPFLLSEPEAGSDATSQKTIAEDMGDHYLVNGTKKLDNKTAQAQVCTW